MLDNSHPFIVAVTKYVGAPRVQRTHMRRIENANDVCSALKGYRGAITNIDVADIPKAAAMLIAADPKAAKYVGDYAP